MATARDVAIKGYCDRVYDELFSMKGKMLDFVKEIELMRGPESELLKTHIPHFQDIIRTIDWKLEILTKVCPFDWMKYSGDVERTSVSTQVETVGKETVSGGYIGG
jgi:hypothetical protein